MPGLRPVRRLAVETTLLHGTASPSPNKVEKRHKEWRVCASTAGEYVNFTMFFFVRMMKRTNIRTFIFHFPTRGVVLGFQQGPDKKIRGPGGKTSK